MMESLFGPHPPRHLVENLPDGITPEAAVSAWRTGLYEGGEGMEYRTFESNPDIQPLYYDGWQRGNANRSVSTLLGHEQEEVEPDRQWWDRLPDWVKKPLMFVAGTQPVAEGLVYWLGSVYLLIRIARSLVGRD